MAPDTTNNTYSLEVDGNQCFVVGGGSLAAGVWSWVDYHDGVTTSKINLSLTQGTHNLKFIGRQPDVKLDRLVFTSDLTCIPAGNGDNCNVPSDTTPPAVSLTAPAEGSTVSGKTVSVTANASDDVAVTKVEFYLDSTLQGTSTAAPYTYTWDSTTAANGAHLLSAKAYDAAGNSGTSSYSVTVQNGDAQAPTTPDMVTATAQAYNQVVVNWTASTDNVGVKGYNITRDGVLLAQTGAVTSYTDQTVTANSQYTYTVSAFDAAGNVSAPSSIAAVTTPSVPDSTPPSAPGNLTATPVSSSQINLSWQASADNIGVKSYDVYRWRGLNAPQKIATVTTTTYGDTGLSANTQYNYYIKANDASGNVSQQSNTATAKTNAKRRTTRIVGVVSGSVIPNAQVKISIAGVNYTTTTNARGSYIFRDVPPGRYNVSYNAAGYYSRSLPITVADYTVTMNVKLQKK